MFRLIIIAFVALSFFGCSGSMRIRLPENPKVAVYWTSPTMSLDEADSLARFHLVIADMENIVNNRESLVELKKLNPKVKLLCYSNPMEFFEERILVINRPLQKKAYDEVSDNRAGYWLNQPSGKPVVFWNGMKMLNLSTMCPVVEGENYGQFISRFLLQEVLQDKIWDGYFMDNSGGNISWVGSFARNHGIDADNDGTLDDPAALDSSWYEGVCEFLQTIRKAKGNKFIIIGNKGSLDYLEYSLLNGKMFEEFPNSYLGGKEADGWYKCEENYSQTGPYSIIHAKHDKEHRLFVLASALMGDGYFAYSQDFFRYYPEYGHDLGKPLGPAEYKNGCCERKFSNAIVRVWPEEKRAEIVY